MDENNTNFIVVLSDPSANSLYGKIMRGLRAEDIVLPVMRAESLKEAALLSGGDDRSILIADTRNIRSFEELAETYNSPGFPWEKNDGMLDECSFSPPKKGDSAEEAKYILTYVCTHIGEDLNLKSLSSLIGMSPNYLCTLFHKQTGIPLGKFIRQNRLSYAAYLLETEWTQVEDIASRVGFTSSSYFCKLFKEAYGLTPNKYRMKRSRLRTR